MFLRAMRSVLQLGHAVSRSGNRCAGIGRAKTARPGHVGERLARFVAMLPLLRFRFHNDCTEQGALAFQCNHGEPWRRALEIREFTHPDKSQDIYQRIYDTEGGSAEQLIATIPDTFSIAGRHLYLTGFSQYNLRTVLPANGVGPIVSTHDKTSSGIVDSIKYSPPVPGSSPVPQYGNTTNPAIPMGISVGWADIYRRAYPNQWIDITGLNPGQYWLEVISDPYDRIIESNEDNNTTQVLIDIPSIPEPQNQAGDYNLDGEVDAADYVKWRETFGTLTCRTAPEQMATRTGSVSGPGLDVWKAHFGIGGSGGGATTTVPEPGTFTLLLGIAVVFQRRRRAGF